MCARFKGTRIRRPQRTRNNASKNKTLNQCCFNVGPLSTTLRQHWLNASWLLGIHVSKHKTFTKWWLNVSCFPGCDIMSQMFDQHYTRIGSMSVVCLNSQFCHPSKYNTLKQCWFDVGPAS